MNNLLQCITDGIRRIGIVGHVRPDGDCAGSVMAAYWLKDSLFLPDISMKLSEVINEKMSNVKLLSLPWVYFGVLITLPVGFHHGDLAGIFPFLTLELKSLLLSMFIS